MTATLPPADDSDFDFDALVAESVEQMNTARRAKSAAAKSPSMRTPADRAAMDVYADTRWRTVASVAVIRTQLCVNCGRTNQWFTGWMLEQAHATDSHARRLKAVAGPDLQYVVRQEDHAQPPTPHCPACIGAYMATHQALVVYELQRPAEPNRADTVEAE